MHRCLRTGTKNLTAKSPILLKGRNVFFPFSGSRVLMSCDISSEELLKRKNGRAISAVTCAQVTWVIIGDTECLLTLFAQKRLCIKKPELLGLVGITVVGLTICGSFLSWTIFSFWVAALSVCLACSHR